MVKDFPLSNEAWAAALEELKGILNETPRALDAHEHKALLDMLRSLADLNSTMRNYALSVAEEAEKLCTQVAVLRDRFEALAAGRYDTDDDKPKDPTIN